MGYSMVEVAGDLVDQSFQRHVCISPAFAVSGYLVILTIDALKVAVGKKDIANPVLSADDGLLPFVNAHRTDVES